VAFNELGSVPVTSKLLPAFLGETLIVMGKPLAVTLILSGCVFADALKEKFEPTATSVFSAGIKSVNLGLAQALVLLLPPP